MKSREELLKQFKNEVLEEFVRDDEITPMEFERLQNSIYKVYDKIRKADALEIKTQLCALYGSGTTHARPAEETYVSPEGREYHFRGEQHDN